MNINQNTWKRVTGKLILLLLLGSLIACGGLIAIRVSPEDIRMESGNWLTLGGNEYHQHFSLTNIPPPLNILWKKKVPSVITDHPLGFGNYIIAVTKNGFLHIINSKKGFLYGNGRVVPGVTHVPTLMNSLLVLGSNLGDHALAFYDLSSADMVQKRRYPAIATTPLVKEGKVFFGTERSVFYCASFPSGERIWDFRTRGAVYSSPAWYSGSIIFADVKGWLYALEASSGVLIWEKELQGNIFGHPVIAGGRVFQGTVEGNLYALNAENGKLLWRTKTKGSIYGGASVFDDMVYVGNNAHQVLAVQQQTGQIYWEGKTEGIVNTVPLPSPDFLYVTCWDKVLYVFDRRSGELLFSKEFSRPLKTSPIIFRNMLLIQTANENLFALVNRDMVAKKEEGR